MSVYTQQVPYQAAEAPPPPGDAVGFNFRLTQAGTSDQTGETWASTEMYPNVYSIVGGGTKTAGWGAAPLAAYNTSGVTDRRLKGGTGILGGINFVLAHTNHGEGAGTYRVRMAIGLYVQFTCDMGLYDGFNIGTNVRGTLLHQVTVSLLANQWTNTDSVARNEASWVSAYDSVFVDVVVTDQGADTGLVLGSTGTNYVAHAQVEKIA